MKLLITLTLTLAALAPAGVFAKASTGPLTKSQCDRLNELWWQAEDDLTGISSCRTLRCTMVRSDILLYQAQIAGIWSAGKCDRHYARTTL